jgi:hypothetical protein
MSVIVDHGFISDALDIEARTGRAEGAQADRDAEDPVHLGADRHQFGERLD